jgi:uncharacterized membrane protein
MILPISAFQVAKITGMSHWHLASMSVFIVCEFSEKAAKLGEIGNH